MSDGKTFPDGGYVDRDSGPRPVATRCAELATSSTIYGADDG